ncbi:DNA repair protein RecN [Brevibacterium linens]|uniref:DNA repair protein RecN n=1 Tax=Brevibacterium linens ATCC 9172 TaxID=1255617 RepID=A0A2H1HHK2_BRELN|nr:DNA repair protein RecN [Brevibacterium linens]AZU01119.1 DNA repair protein RecN [Brevibacterium linens]KAB1949381.1 DNA repair protein RecN [Brevibacterium linens ATCC 9172]SMX62346.1 DNA repair protein RecN (Recombination protein N) [Brevibacterium linens ATCC 9172]
MISELRISHLGVIAEAAVELDTGFTVVTGETGAGKTMFVSALSLLMGRKVGSGVVRKGAEKAEVEGIFTGVAEPVRERIEEAGGSADDEAIISRTVALKGRARATAGGRTVPISVLTDISSDLITLHGQSEQLRLKGAAQQRQLLDAAGGTALAEVAERYRAAFETWRETEARVSRIKDSTAARRERILWLRGCLEAIDKVRPEPGEDETLAAQSAKLGAAAEITRAVGAAHDLLLGSEIDDAGAAVDLVHQAISAITDVEGSDKDLVTIREALGDAVLRLSDSAAELSNYLSGFDELGETSLEETEARRAELGTLAPYGQDVAEVLDFETRSAAELAELEAEDRDLDGLDAELDQARETMEAAASALTEIRKSTADEFSAAVSEELAALSMPKASVAFEISEREPTTHGADEVRLTFAAHESSLPDDIAKIASGGELSRVMLAIEVVRAASESIPTYVFDEVDAGVGGKAAVEIGRRLAKLARNAQVIVVTHLPQVAAWADTHVTIVKDDEAETVRSGVAELTDSERVVELSRMLAGMDDSASAKAHAAELLDNARQVKEAGVGSR